MSYTITKVKESRQTSYLFFCVKVINELKDIDWITDTDVFVKLFKEKLDALIVKGSYVQPRNVYKAKVINDKEIEIWKYNSSSEPLFITHKVIFQ